MTIALRPAGPGDEELFLRLYGSTRADELALVDWDDGKKEAFVRQQFEAQSAHYREHYPTMTRDVVEDGGVPVGRLLVERWTAEIRIVDVAVLPEHRGRGIGEELLRGVIAEGDSSGRAVTIHVERFNQAQRLYARLGFVAAGERGPVYMLMRREPSGTT